MQQKAAMERRRASLGLKELFRKSERAWPWAHFHNNSPEERQDVQPAPHWPATRPQCSKNHQSKPYQMSR